MLFNRPSSKKIRAALLRAVFFLVAFQVLNLSIDLDFMVCDHCSTAATVGYNDTDTFAEFVIEKITGHNIFDSEGEQDESGCANAPELEKWDAGNLYIDGIQQHAMFYADNHISSWPASSRDAGKITKGYFLIFSPPPEI